ncbi:MAG: hypothetical protein ABEJ28_06315, partial [Salinigranum sp.]
MGRPEDGWSPVSEEPASPGVHPRRLVRNAWNTLHTVYYANAVSWRALKSGGLFVFGFFLWAGSNVLLSYQPGWTVLHYTMAYVFVLIGYGPFHHFVVIPLAIRWRRRGGFRTRAGRHLPNVGLAAFLLAVVLLGTFPVGPVTANFRSAQHGGTTDVDPSLHCLRRTESDGADRIHCRLTNTEGVGRVVVTSGGARLTAADAPPFAFTVEASDVRSVAGEREFTVVVEDESGAVARRYTRRLPMIESAPGTSVTASSEKPATASS